MTISDATSPHVGEEGMILVNVLLFVAGTAWVDLAVFLFHAGPISRMPLTRLIACTMYAAPR